MNDTILNWRKNGYLGYTFTKKEQRKLYLTFHCTYTCTSIYCNFCSDDDFELPVISKAAQKEITQQLIKDGYNLDLEPDDEDLDLIPPRPVNERCTCCNYYTGYCAIQ